VIDVFCSRHSRAGYELLSLTALLDAALAACG